MLSSKLTIRQTYLQERGSDVLVIQVLRKTYDRKRTHFLHYSGIYIVTTATVFKSRDDTGTEVN